MLDEESRKYLWLIAFLIIIGAVLAQVIGGNGIDNPNQDGWSSFPLILFVSMGMLYFYLKKRFSKKKEPDEAEDLMDEEKL